MSIDVSRLEIDSRDYLTIFQDLINSIPELTDKWVTNDENDPGVALVKLMSMLGDMISYNHDQAVLEIYPDTVSQRKNAAQIFNLIGYKMRWYQSSRCTAFITNSYYQTATMVRYSTFSSENGKLIYTYTGNANDSWLNLDTINDNPGKIYEVELVQGVPVTPALVGDYLILHDNPNAEWHEAYNYNISLNNIVNDNRIYFFDNNVDEYSVTLVGGGNEWTQVEDMDTLTTTGLYYEFKVDEYDRPYVQLVDYWKQYNQTGNFKLFYVRSSGEDGQVAENGLTKSLSKIFSYDSTSHEELNVSSYIHITNRNSTFGYGPETADEARKEYGKYINTHDTFVTLEDFTRAVKRLYGVANCYCTDRTNDPNPTDLSLFDLNVYISETDDYKEAVDQEAYKLYIESSLRENKMIPLIVNVILDGITYYNWNFNGKIYTKELVTPDRAQDMIVTINDKIKEVYDISNMEFNSIVNYIDIIDLMLATDPLIKNIYLEPLNFVEEETQTEVSVEDITGKYTTKAYFTNHPTKVFKTIHLTSAHQIVDANEEVLNYVYYIDLNNNNTPTKLTLMTRSGKYVLGNNDSGIYFDLTKDDKYIYYMTNESTVDTSIYGYYLDGKFYSDYECTEEMTPINGRYYTDKNSYNITEQDYTSVYLYNNSTYTLQSDYTIRYLDCTVLPTDNKGNVTIINIPIKPSKFVINIDNGRHYIYDNNNGEFVSESGMFEEGTINYQTGDIYVKMVSEVTNFTISYSHNVINLLRFVNIDINNFYVAEECIKRT